MSFFTDCPHIFGSPCYRGNLTEGVFSNKGRHRGLPLHNITPTQTLPLNAGGGKLLFSVPPALRGKQNAQALVDCRLEEAADVLLAHLRLARRHIVQLAFPHPPLQLVDQLKEMVERVDDEQ